MSAKDQVKGSLRPRSAADAGSWLRANLFEGVLNTVATLALIIVSAFFLWKFIDWAIIRAVWTPDLNACRALEHSGACWGVIAEKFRLIFFGRYPYAQQWRPVIATLMMMSLIACSCLRLLSVRNLLFAWLCGFAAFFVLMRGDGTLLPLVETTLWGGFPLTLLLSTVGIAGAFPLAIFIALGRRSHLPAIRTICVTYVELVRGVPLVSVLFLASFLFPLLMPAGWTLDKLVRVMVGIVLFAAAYLAEVVRGGLQAVPTGQVEAAATLGFNYWQAQYYIVLPQALRAVVPALVNTFIGIFKDTSLVVIVSLYELTGSLQLALGDADWRSFYLEGYIFIASIYFICCFSMSRYSSSVELRLDKQQN